MFVSEDVAWVDFPAVLVDFLAVDTGGTVPRLQVQTDACEIGESICAPGAFDVLPDMYR